jgi:hypothetical protein
MHFWFFKTATATQAPTYYRIESRYPHIPILAPLLTQMDELVEKRDLHTLRMCVGVYLVKLGMFSEDLIRSIDAQSHVITHVGVHIYEDSRNNAEKLFDECVFWRNEFVELFYQSAPII